MSSQALEKRFTKVAAEFLQTLLEKAVAPIVQAPVMVPIELLNRFNRVYLIDGSLLPLPSELAERWRGTGKEGEANYAALKLEAGFERRSGRLTGPNCLPGRWHDKRGPLANQPLGTDCLRVQDWGYWMAEPNRHGEHWLSRFKLGTTLWTQAGEPVDLPRWLIHLSHQGIEQTEPWLRLGTQGDLNARLIIQQMPPEVANRRRATLNQRQQKTGKQPSQRELAVFDGTLLVTSVPEERLCIDEALIWYAARWQIELLFKLWKSQAQLAQSRSEKPWRHLCEI